MMDETIKAVELVFKVTGLDKMAPNIAIIERIRKTTGETTKAAHKMGDAISRGVDRSVAAMDRLNDRLSSAMNTMKSMVSLGSILATVMKMVSSNASAEETSLSLAGTINSFGLTRGSGGDALSQFRAARGEADAMMQRMRDMAAVLPGTATDYVQAIRGQLTPLLGAGLNLQQIATFVSQGTAVGLSYGIDASQSSRDMSRIIKGHGSAQERMWREVVQPQLQNRGVTDQQWKAKTDRQRVDMLSGMFGGDGGFGPMLREFENTWSAQMGTMQSNFEDIFREGGSGIFDEMKGVLRDINEYVGSMKNQFIEIVKQGGQFLHVIRPLLPVIAGSHALSAATGKGLGGWTMAYMNAVEGKPTAALNWMSAKGGSGMTSLRGFGRGAGGFLSSMGGALAGTASDVASTGLSWGRAAGGRLGDALSRGGKALSGLLQGALARGVASGPVRSLAAAASAIRGGAKSLRDRAVAGLWEARFQAGQALSPVYARARGALGSARAMAGGALGRARDYALSGLFEARFQAGRALSPVGAGLRGAGSWLSGVGNKGLAFFGGAANLLPRAIAGSSVGRMFSRATGAVGGALAGAGSRIGLDVAGMAGRTAQRFGFLGETLRRTGSSALAFGGKTGQMLKSILPYAGSLVGSFAKLGIYALVIAVLVTGIREIMKSAEAQARIMGAVDRFMGSMRVLFASMAEAFGPEFNSMFKDILPKTLEGIINAFTWIFTNAQALGRYLGDLAYDIANPSAPRTRREFGYYQAEVRGEMLREAQRYQRERRQAERSGGGRGNSRANQPSVHQDFRGSHFHVTQQFAPGYDPDRIAVGFTSRIEALGRRRLQSNFGPMYSVR